MEATNSTWVAKLPPQAPPPDFRSAELCGWYPDATSGWINAFVAWIQEEYARGAQFEQRDPLESDIGKVILQQLTTSAGLASPDIDAIYELFCARWNELWDFSKRTHPEFAVEEAWVAGHGAQADASEAFIPSGQSVSMYVQEGKGLETFTETFALRRQNNIQPFETYNGPCMIPNYVITPWDSPQSTIASADEDLVDNIIFIEMETPLCADVAGCNTRGAHECSGTLGDLNYVRDLHLMICRGLRGKPPQAATSGFQMERHGRAYDDAAKDMLEEYAGRPKELETKVVALFRDNELPSHIQPSLLYARGENSMKLKYIYYNAVLKEELAQLIAKHGAKYGPLEFAAMCSGLSADQLTRTRADAELKKVLDVAWRWSSKQVSDLAGWHKMKNERDKSLVARIGHTPVGKLAHAYTEDLEKKTPLKAPLAEMSSHSDLMLYEAFLAGGSKEDFRALFDSQINSGKAITEKIVCADPEARKAIWRSLEGRDQVSLLHILTLVKQRRLAVQLRDLESVTLTDQIIDAIEEDRLQLWKSLRRYQKTGILRMLASKGLESLALELRLIDGRNTAQRIADASPQDAARIWASLGLAAKNTVIGILENQGKSHLAAQFTNAEKLIGATDPKERDRIWADLTMSERDTVTAILQAQGRRDLAQPQNNS